MIGFSSSNDVGSAKIRSNARSSTGHVSSGAIRRRASSGVSNMPVVCMISNGPPPTSMSGGGMRVPTITGSTRGSKVGSTS